MLSEGEYKKPKTKHPGDPFDKFLSKLCVSHPEDTSTPPFSHGDDDTFSEMPSIDNNSTAFKPPEAPKHEITPLVTLNRQRPRLTVPYYKKYPLKQTSPGEIQE